MSKPVPLPAQCIPMLWKTAAFLVAPLAAGFAYAAENFPSRPVRMIVPFLAGGPADIVGRLYAQKITDLWGQQVIIDNRAGAAGIIGTEIATKSAPDGHTLLFGSVSTFALNGILMKNLPYDAARDLELIGLVAIAPCVLAVRTGLPARNVQELIALAKQQPRKLTFASAGPGTIVHMAGALFNYRAAIDVLHVPFKGGAVATMGLLTGEADMIVNDMSTVFPQIKGGRLRVIGVAHASRLQLLPEVPTFAEQGLSGAESSTWWGVAVPKSTPRTVATRIKAAHDKAIARPDYVERLAGLAIEPFALTADQTSAFVRREIEKWQKVATAANVRIE